MAERPHGTRKRYVWGPAGYDREHGCRCEACTEANRLYARQRYRDLRSWREPSDSWYVDAGPARDHLVWLSGQGIGLRSVERRAGVVRHTLQQIVSGKSKRCTRRTEKAVLGVGLHAAQMGARVDAAETWLRIEDLLAAGWTKVAIAREIHGPQALALQLRPGMVLVRNAKAVTDLHARALPQLGGRPRRRAEGAVGSPVFPLAPLAAAAGLSENALCLELRVNPARVRAGLDERRADEFATRLGLHPLLVWGEAWAS